MGEILLLASPFNAAFFWFVSWMTIADGGWFFAGVAALIATLWTIPAAMLLIGFCFWVWDRIVRETRA